MTKNVLVTGSSIDEKFFHPLLKAGFSIENPPGVLIESQLSKFLARADYYLLGGDEVATANALNAAKKLKLISFLGVGYENFVDAKYAGEMGILITNTPGTLTNSVAEFTIGSLINIRRRISFYSNEFAANRHGQEKKSGSIFSDSVGILGMGVIGTRIAEIITQGFKVSVSYHNRNRRPVEEKQLGVKYKSLDKLFQESSALIVAASTNNDSKGLIDQNLLRQMPKGSALVNCAHYSLVEPNALVSALSDGPLEAAMIDGFYDQDEVSVADLKKLMPYPLVVTGHVASLTHSSRDAMAKMAIDSIIEYENTGTATHLVA